jgi:hypothetical protein
MHLLEHATPANHDEIAQLAFLNWQQDGCPEGHDEAYWLEAEQQITATKHLLIQEIKQRLEQMEAAAKSKFPETRKTRGAVKQAQ